MLSRKSIRGVVFGGLVVVATAGVAAAQSGGAAQPDGAASVARQVSLTPQEQVKEAAAMLARMESSRSVVRHELETARAERDVVKVLCLNDKLTQIDVIIRSANERRASLESAAARSDVDLANHSFTLLSIFRQRVEAVSAEANACIGTGPYTIDESSVRVTDENDMKEDPSEYPSSDVFIEVPSCSSCFK
ncbi:MAG: hypothetical protein U0441_31860 [Polyangiaceae bacterium]